MGSDKIFMFDNPAAGESAGYYVNDSCTVAE